MHTEFQRNKLGPTFRSLHLIYLTPWKLCTSARYSLLYHLLERVFLSFYLKLFLKYSSVHSQFFIFYLASTIIEISSSFFINKLMVSVYVYLPTFYHLSPLSLSDPSSIYLSILLYNYDFQLYLPMIYIYLIICLHLSITYIAYITLSHVYLSFI